MSCPSATILALLLTQPEADANARSSRGMTPLNLAAAFDELSGRDLPFFGFRKLTQSTKGGTSTKRSSKAKTVLQRLLDGGGDIEARDSLGRTPLWNAVRFDKQSNIEVRV